MSIKLRTGLVLAGARSDTWAIQNPPSGSYWRCWQCNNGTHVNDFILHFDAWPIIGNNWYYAGPFLTSEEADAYAFDGNNPCGNFTDVGTGDSNLGGGSGYTGDGVGGGGLRFIFTNPPVGSIPDIADCTVNGVPVDVTPTYKSTTLPVTLGG